jgi:hypothetical protein
MDFKKTDKKKKYNYIEREILKTAKDIKRMDMDKIPICWFAINHTADDYGKIIKTYLNNYKNAEQIGKTMLDDNLNKFSFQFLLRDFIDESLSDELIDEFNNLFGKGNIHIMYEIADILFVNRRNNENGFLKL